MPMPESRKVQVGRIHAICLSVRKVSGWRSFSLTGSADRGCQQKGTSFVKAVKRHGSRNRRESFQKFVQCFTALKIVEEGLNRHTGTPENRDAMHGVRVSNYHVRHVCIVAQSTGWPPSRVFGLKNGSRLGPKLNPESMA